MSTSFGPSANALRRAMIALWAACLSAPAMAEEINLRSSDGTVDLYGEFIAYEDGDYVIDSTFGTLRVRGSDVDCFGAACPIAAAGAGGPVTWDVSLWGKRRAFTEHVEKLAELVDEKTDGAFTLNLDYGGLSPSRENLDGISAGKFEMAQFCNGYHPEKTPTLGVMELPFLGVDSLELETALSRTLHAHPAVEADLARWNATLLMPSPQPQNNIMGVGQPPMSLGDFEGMNIRSTGGIGRAVEALGADAVTIPAPGVKDALDDGTIQAVAFAPHAHMAFGTIESGSWWTTNLNPGTSHCPVVANTDALDALSPAHRVALLSSVEQALDHYVDNYQNVTMGAWGPALQERFVIELTFSDEIIWAIDTEVAAPAAAAWIEENAARGVPARELYDLVSGMIAGGS